MSPFDRRTFLGAAAATACAAALPARASASVWATGASAPAYADFDRLFGNYMLANNVRAGQFAIGRGGKVLFAHAYTNADASYMRTRTDSIMRVASVSKAFTSAGITELLKTKKFTLDTKAFPYLGVRETLLKTQVPDPRIEQITIGQLVAHTSGLPGSGQGDPEFAYRDIERAVGAAGPLTQEQFTRYLYGVHLNSDPGAKDVYSNVGYYLLGRIIEKASGKKYLEYLNAAVLGPLGIDDVYISATDIAKRLPNEVHYDDDHETGLSVLQPQTEERLPLPYGGATYWETFDACSAIATTAASIVTLMGTYATWGIGPRHGGDARVGAMPGNECVMYSRPDGIDYAYTFNQRFDDGFDTDFRKSIDTRIAQGI